jgi:hypothetical protein
MTELVNKKAAKWRNDNRCVVVVLLEAFNLQMPLLAYVEQALKGKLPWPT